MARSRTWLNARQSISDMTLCDALRIDRANIRRLLARCLADPNHPANQRRRQVEAALADPLVQQAYFRIRRAIWSWPEFASLRIATRRLLESLIELARDEALPWRLAVPSRHLRPLARMKWRHFVDAVRELEGLVVVRPARRVMLGLSKSSHLPAWPGRVDDSRPLADIPQWVVRHQRGTRSSTAGGSWWVNYDLLCATGRVLPCFVVCLETLPKGGRQVRARMGPVRPGRDSQRALAELERDFAARGPLPPPGLSAALWRPPASD